MAQASSSIRYQVCNEITDNDNARLSTSKSFPKTPANLSNDERNAPLSSSASQPKVSSPNHHHGSALTELRPTSSTRSIESTRERRGTSDSTQPLAKRAKPSASLQNQSQRSSVVSSNVHRSTSKPLVNETSATARKSSIAPAAAAQPSQTQHRLSTDNANLFSTYQGNDEQTLSTPGFSSFSPPGDFIRQSKQLRKARRQDIKARFEKFDLNPSAARRNHASRRFTFIFDPSGRLTYWWTSIISLAFLYNFWIIIFRFSFYELTPKNLHIWFIFDYSCDFLYLMDIMFNFRTAYLEEGVLQTDPIKLRHYYMNTTRFYIDCLCLMPLDFLYLSIGFKSIVRLFRLVKIYRFWTFLDRTERHTNYPNLFRTIVMIHYLLAIFHWNACLIYILHSRSEFGFTRRFSFTFDDNGLDYFKAL